MEYFNLNIIVIIQNGHPGTSLKRTPFCATLLERFNALTV